VRSVRRLTSILRFTFFRKKTLPPPPQHPCWNITDNYVSVLSSTRPSEETTTTAWSRSGVCLWSGACRRRNVTYRNRRGSTRVRSRHAFPVRSFRRLFSNRPFVGKYEIVPDEFVPKTDHTVRTHLLTFKCRSSAFVREIHRDDDGTYRTT